MTSFFDSFTLKASVIATLALGGCIATSYPYLKTETAQRIAAPAWMIKRDVSAAPFVLRAYERIHDRGGVAHLYIEGEGQSSATDDPTPENPVALHLASKDKADNVIYLARPCQYTGMVDQNRECDSAYIHSARFSREVIDAYNVALDDIRSRYGIRMFHVIGYAGGASIGTFLASERDDIVTLRTVAGILDHETYTEYAGIAPLENSLNPVNEASSISKVPQYHFIGGRDNQVPPAVLHSFLQATPPTKCVQTLLIQEAEHDTGWVDKWPELLELKPSCSSQNQSTSFSSPETEQYTFWDYQAGAWQKNNGIRIDHFLLSPVVADRAQSCTINAAPRGWEKPSDHTAIELTLSQ